VFPALAETYQYLQIDDDNLLSFTMGFSIHIETYSNFQ